jgi:hypothetical protein
MAGRRTLDWVLIVVLSGVWALLFARGIVSGHRTGFGQLAVSVSSATDVHAYPLVLNAGAWEELKPGDRLEAVDGESLLDSSAIRFYDRAIRGARERGFASIRASRSGTPFEIRLGLTSVPGWWVELLGAAVQFLVGLLLLVRAPDWHLARRNFLMLAGTAALNVTFDWKVTEIRGTWLEVAACCPGRGDHAHRAGRVGVEHRGNQAVRAARVRA